MDKPIGSIYSRIQKNNLWRLYYSLFGIPFMSSHIVYWLIKNNIRLSGKERILDYGTGDGLFLNQLSFDFGVSGLGVDRLPERIEKAKKISEIFKLNNSFLISSFDKLESSSRFDIVLCFDVLEHVGNLDQEIKRISELMNDNGKLIIQTPRGEDTKILLKKELEFSYGEDKHMQPGFDLIQLTHTLNKHGLKVIYWRSDFSYVSQLIYEALEIIRSKSKIVYASLWPIFYPLCLVDHIINVRSKSNGLFLIAQKI